MASSWGLSWGTSWGNSWGAIEEQAELDRPFPIHIHDTQVIFGKGINWNRIFAEQERLDRERQAKADLALQEQRLAAEEYRKAETRRIAAERQRRMARSDDEALLMLLVSY